MEDSEVLKERDAVEKLINGKGRVLLCESGTEPVIRIMTECETERLCVEYAERIADAITKGGHTIG